MSNGRPVGPPTILEEWNIHPAIKFFIGILWFVFLLAVGSRGLGLW